MALPTPSTEPGRTGLAALLAAPDKALLGLDFDGTLAPIVPDPGQARAHPEVAAALTRLAAGGVRLAVVTGRPAAVAVEYGNLAAVPGLVVLGHYGRERWDGGAVSAPPASEGVETARRLLPGLLAGAAEGTYVEDKGAAVAVHTRRTPDPAAAFEALRAPLQELADRTGLTLEPGRFVLELRPAGGDKGDAVRLLASELTPSVVVFAGDDLGDLAAFDAVDDLRRAGTPGLLICSGSAEVVELAQRADLVVNGPEGVVALLSAVADSLRPEG
jgi:trehalose 6-phosphate phosphatase